MSDEQITQERAVEIAEWLGLVLLTTPNKYFPPPNEKPWYVNREGDFITDNPIEEYLHSPEGQSAVMDKVMKCFGYVLFEADRHDGGCWCGIDSEKEQKAKTRQHALLLAVLEMLKGKT